MIIINWAGNYFFTINNHFYEENLNEFTSKNDVIVKAECFEIEDRLKD